MYGTDLAWVHHRAFGELARAAAGELAPLLAGAGLGGGTVVDLGCGGGVLLRELTAAGHRAVGVDLSPALLALARETVPGATLVEGSAWEVDLPPCVAVTAIGEVLSYLPPGKAEAPDPGVLFDRIARALAPGGLFLFDVLVSGSGEPMSYRSRREGEGWTVEVEVEEDVAAGRLTRRIVTSRRLPEGRRVSEETHRLRVFEPTALLELLSSTGFEATTSESYGRSLLPERRAVFRARWT